MGTIRKILKRLARPGRVELPTLCLEGRRSIQTELRARGCCSNPITELAAFGGSRSTIGAGLISARSSRIQVMISKHGYRITCEMCSPVVGQRAALTASSR